MVSFKTFIVSDFNIWMDDHENRNTVSFGELLESYQLSNKVSSVTSSTGHMLDLVINDDVNNLMSGVDVEHGVFILKLILSYLPVHLISPHFNLPDTHIKHFSHSTSENTLLPVTYVWHLHAGSSGITPLHLQFSIRH